MISGWGRGGSHCHDHSTTCDKWQLWQQSKSVWLIKACKLHLKLQSAEQINWRGPKMVTSLKGAGDIEITRKHLACLSGTEERDNIWQPASVPLPLGASAVITQECRCGLGDRGRPGESVRRAACGRDTPHCWALCGSWGQRSRKAGLGRD